MRDRSADHRGQGPFNQNCQFPFTYNGVTYDSCTDQDNAGVPWCSVFNDLFGNYQEGFWGNCLSRELELAQETFSNSSQSCSDSRYHVCTAAANYGFIAVNFEERVVEMSVRTPREGEQMSHIIKY